MSVLVIQVHQFVVWAWISFIYIRFNNILPGL